MDDTITIFFWDFKKIKKASCKQIKRCETEKELLNLYKRKVKVLESYLKQEVTKN